MLFGVKNREIRHRVIHMPTCVYMLGVILGRGLLLRFQDVASLPSRDGVYTTLLEYLGRRYDFNMSHNLWFRVNADTSPAKNLYSNASLVPVRPYRTDVTAMRCSGHAPVYGAYYRCLDIRLSHARLCYDYIFVPKHYSFRFHNCRPKFGR